MDFLADCSPQKRGLKFEKLINEIFGSKNMLICPSYRTSEDVEEQVDGAIRLSGRIFLLEVKWSKSENLAESDLYAFLGKIRTKMPGTLGLFVSFNRLSENFMKAIRYGQQQICIVVHGEENIEAIIDEKVDLNSYLTYLYEMASAKGILEFNIKDYLNLHPSKETCDYQSLWDEIVDAVRSDGVSEMDFGIKYRSKKYDGLFENVINIFPYLDYKDYKKYELLLSYCFNESNEKFCEIFLRTVVGNEFDKFLKPVSMARRGFFQSSFSSSFIEMMNRLHLNFGGQRYELDGYVDKLVKILNDEKGAWENENVVSLYVEIVLPVLNENQLMKLADPYFEIYMSKSRKKDNGYGRIFENKKVSKDVIAKVKGVADVREKIFIPFIKKELQDWSDSLSRFEGRDAKESVKIVWDQYREELVNIGLEKSDIERVYEEINSAASI
jgi:hypothetical protein